MFVTDSAEGTTSQLYRNNGNMTFTDVTAAGRRRRRQRPAVDRRRRAVVRLRQRRLDETCWSSGSARRCSTTTRRATARSPTSRQQSGLTKFGNTIAAIAFDYDNDGKLDLLFGNYFKPENLLELKSPHVLPNDLDNAVNGGGVTLWKGDGTGKLGRDVTDKAGFTKHTGWTLDVGHGDFNNDGRQDIYLACDYGTDRLYFNNGDGTFTDVTEKAHRLRHAARA